MRKLFLSCFMFVILIFSFGSMAMAANSEAYSLNVNGVQINDQKPVIIDQTTMVPIRTVSLISNLEVNWDNKTKTVTVMNTTSKETLKLTLNKREAYKGSTKLNLRVSPRNINGSIYVPLRFIGESMDAYVAWDVESKTAVIYNSDVDGADESKDIALTREAVLSLPRISLQEHIATTSESHITEYYFPYGKTQKFYIIDKDIVQYYEVKNHAAWEIWEGKISDMANLTNQTGDKDVVPNLVHTVSKEWGKRPTYSGAYISFIDEWMYDKVTYDMIDDNGKRTELGSFTRSDNTEPFIIAIEGEERLD
jgi:hypothetical protein